MNYYFIGIGGISMSAIATLLINEGHIVNGCDIADSDVIKNLQKIGVNIRIKNDNSLPNYTAIKNADFVVFTNAVGSKNKDLLYAKKLGKQIYERAELLGEIAAKYECTIAISGTHGKTTTTAMLGQIFVDANLKPTIHLGGIYKNFNGNYLLGDKKFFITEGCEYNKSFLHLTPQVSVITNIEKEHIDTYATLSESVQAFIKFAEKTTNKVFVCGDNIPAQLECYMEQQIEKINLNNPTPCARADVVPNLQDKKFITYGLNQNNNIWATNLIEQNAIYSYDCWYFGKFLGKVTLGCAGKHNVYNSLAVIGICLQFNISWETITASLNKFYGVMRRYSLIYKNEITHISDYAHHPTEIEATIATALLQKKGRLVVIFQPHTFSRTKALMPEFAKCFAGADLLYLLPTYRAREKEIAGGFATDIFYQIKNVLNVQCISRIENLYLQLDIDLYANDTILWLGAGDIDKYCKEYCKNRYLDYLDAN